MAKRKQVEKQHVVVSHEQPTTEPGPGYCRLLSLPPEIRLKTWRAVIATDQILIFRNYWPKPQCPQPGSLTSFSLQLGSISIPQTHSSKQCRYHEQHARDRNLLSDPLRTADPGILSWLRTNRQIHTEAQAIVYQSLNIHVADVPVFVALLLPPQKSKFSGIRSLSFCLTMTIEHDLRDGFKFSSGKDWHGWFCGHRPLPGPNNCACELCEVLSAPKPDVLPGLRELELRITLRCKRGQGNNRPTLGLCANGRPKQGQLYRPKNPSPLICVDYEGKIEDLVKDFCEQRPISYFKGRKLQCVTVAFYMEKVEHDRSNTCPHVRDKCWCIGRSIDEESLAAMGIAKKIRSTLMCSI